MIAASCGFCTTTNRIPFGLRQSDRSWLHNVDHGQVAKGIGSLNGIKEEHEADQRPIDGRGSVTFGQQVISIGFGISGCDLGGSQARVFLLQPGGKAAGILGIKRDGFGRQIRAQVQLFPAWAVISFHITPPCDRQSCIIGAVFGEIAPATLPIIYHIGGKTVPIISL